MRRLHIVGLFTFGDSLAKIGSHFRPSSPHPRLHFVFRKDVRAVGATAAHIDDILGRGEGDVSSKNRVFLERRLGRLRAQKSPIAHAGAEL